MRDDRHIPGPQDINELILRQLSYDNAKDAGKPVSEWLNTGWAIGDLWELKESFEYLDDYS